MLTEIIPVKVDTYYYHIVLYLAATPQRMRTCQLFLLCHTKSRLYEITIGQTVFLWNALLETSYQKNLTNCANIKLLQYLSLAKAPAYWHLRYKKRVIRNSIP